MSFNMWVFGVFPSPDRLSCDPEFTHRALPVPPGTSWFPTSGPFSLFLILRIFRPKGDSLVRPAALWSSSLPSHMPATKAPTSEIWEVHPSQFRQSSRGHFLFKNLCKYDWMSGNWRTTKTIHTAVLKKQTHREVDVHSHMACVGMGWGWGR